MFEFIVKRTPFVAEAVVMRLRVSFMGIKMHALNIVRLFRNLVNVNPWAVKGPGRLPSCGYFKIEYKIK